MRASTESLLTQLESLWSLRRAVARLGAGSVLESADELGSYLDQIRMATSNCPEIAGAAGKARDHCLRYILRCHQGDPSEEFRTEALRSINDLEDEILRFKVVDEQLTLADTTLPNLGPPVHATWKGASYQRGPTCSQTV